MKIYFLTHLYLSCRWFHKVVPGIKQWKEKEKKIEQLKPLEKWQDINIWSRNLHCYSTHLWNENLGTFPLLFLFCSIFSSYSRQSYIWGTSCFCSSLYIKISLTAVDLHVWLFSFTFDETGNPLCSKRALQRFDSAVATNGAPQRLIVFLCFWWM